MSAKQTPLEMLLKMLINMPMKGGKKLGDA
jgi:hypothetical protein